MRYDDWKCTPPEPVELTEHSVTELAEESSGAILEACERWLEGDADEDDEERIADAMGWM